MKSPWMVVLLFLVACDGHGIIAKPTAIQYGDSVSLGASGPARLALYDSVDFRHDAWEKEDIAPSKTPYFYEQVVKRGHNNGASANMMVAMEAQLEGQHYTVIVMNAGIHDIQLRHDGVLSGSVPLDVYRHNLEAIAQEAERHADYVIWVNTTPIPDAFLRDGTQMFVKGAEVPYNEVADQVAREHGFYILETDAASQLPDNVHFSGYGYDLLGKHIADCVMAALSGQTTAICHK